jgi:oxalate decarboxylase
MNRRSFIHGTSAIGGFAWLTALAESAPEAGNTPAAKKEEIFSLTNKKPERYPGGTLREMAAADFPAIPNMASALMELEPGGMRGLHWHKTAAEMGYVLGGRGVLTVIDAQNNSEVGLIKEGDLYYVPVGFAHSLVCLGGQPCKLMLVYDDGITVESNANHATDWIKSERAEILTTILGIPGQPLRQSAAGVPLISKGKRLLEVPQHTHGPATRAPSSFRFPLGQMTPITSPGGTFVQASKNDFPMSLTMVGARTELYPRGVREPHWHPNADEWDFVISGRAIITIFEGGDHFTEVELGPGDVGFLKRNAAHAVETVGDEPFVLLSVFNADTFQAIGMSGMVIGTPGELIAQNLGIPQATVNDITKEKRFIAKM